MGDTVLLGRHYSWIMFKIFFLVGAELGSHVWFLNVLELQIHLAYILCLLTRILSVVHINCATILPPYSHYESNSVCT